MNQMSTEYLLQEWGVWLRVQAGVPHYVSPSWALMRDNIQVSRGPDPAIQDEVAMLIDGLVCRLYNRYQEAGTALWNYYRYGGMTYRQLARLMGITHNKAAELVNVGAAWIDSALCQFEEAA